LKYFDFPLGSIHSFAAPQGSAGANTALCTFLTTLSGSPGILHFYIRMWESSTLLKLTVLSTFRKFGKQIQKRQLEVPEYAASFVNYKALKKVRSLFIWCDTEKAMLPKQHLSHFDQRIKHVH
jgi:hypothetical protein